MNQDMEEAIQTIASMIRRSEKAQEKFEQGTSQYTLQKNRIHALYVALSLIKKEIEENDVTDTLGKEIAGKGAADTLGKEEFEKALAPLTSLMSKSEKAQKKLTQGTWQHSMIGDNLKALDIALPLLKKKISELGE